MIFNLKILYVHNLACLRSSCFIRFQLLFPLHWHLKLTHQTPTHSHFRSSLNFCLIHYDSCVMFSCFFSLSSSLFLFSLLTSSFGHLQCAVQHWIKPIQNLSSSHFRVIVCVCTVYTRYVWEKQICSWRMKETSIFPLICVVFGLFFFEPFFHTSIPIFRGLLSFTLCRCLFFLSISSPNLSNFGYGVLIRLFGMFFKCAIYQWTLIVSNSKYFGSSGLFCAQCTSIDGNQNAWKKNVPIQRERAYEITVST